MDFGEANNNYLGLGILMGFESFATDPTSHSGPNQIVIAAQLSKPLN